MRLEGDGLSRRIALYAVIPVLSSATPLVAFPVLARTVDTLEWVALGIGQSVGATCALLVSWGWLQVGATRAAGKSSSELRDLYTESLRSRLLVALPSIPLACAVAWHLCPPGTRSLGVTMALAASVPAFSPAWLSIGRGRPVEVIKHDAGPRFVGAVVGALYVIRNNDAVLALPLLLTVVSLVGMLSYSPPGPVARLGHKPIKTRESIRAQAPAAWAVLVGGAYSTFSVAVVAAASAPTTAAEYATGYRVLVLMSVGIVVVGQATQPWMGIDRVMSRHRRHVTQGLFAVVGTTGGVVLIIAGSTLSEFLFGAELRISEATALALGCAYFLQSSTSYLMRSRLLPAQRNIAILRGTALSALVGLPAMVVLSRKLDAPGAALGLVLSELVLLVWFTASLRVADRQ